MGNYIPHLFGRVSTINLTFYWNWNIIGYEWLHFRITYYPVVKGHNLLFRRVIIKFIYKSGWGRIWSLGMMTFSQAINVNRIINVILLWLIVIFSFQLEVSSKHHTRTRYLRCSRIFHLSLCFSRVVLGSVKSLTKIMSAFSKIEIASSVRPQSFFHVTLYPHKFYCRFNKKKGDYTIIKEIIITLILSF